ncbi:MAG: sigma-70 family RNA polymerase sigma factor [Desulfobacteraceae bacterium]|nr:MAG: sigma-70 family RNA polymerase sigma factor [Desulfobacteraceae bacterium]
MSNAIENNNQISARDLDDQLVRAFQSGQTKAFDQLVIRHQDRVFTVCYRFLGNEQEARDMAQEIFINVYRHLNGFRAEAAFFTWLYRITVNSCKNRLKSLEYKYRKKQVSLSGPFQTESSQSKEMEDGQPSALAALEKKEKGQMIQKAIDALPKEQKMMIVLRDIEGLAYEEIIKLTGLRLGTVKSKLARARILLREKLKGKV